LQRETFSIHQLTHQPAKTKQQQQQQRGSLARIAQLVPSRVINANPSLLFRYSIYGDDGGYTTQEISGRERESPGAICMDYKATQSLLLNLLTAQQRREEEEEGAHTISN
jgi:hypothetical protein